MEQVKIQLTRKVADGYIIPLGPANLVADNDRCWNGWVWGF